MKAKFLLAVLFTAFVGAASAQSIVAKFRIESMRCGGCLGRVTKALKATAGVESVKGDMEKKMVIVSYDAAKVTPSAMKEALADIKMPAADYDPNEVISRQVLFHAGQMRCGGCAGKVKKNIGAEPGVQSVEVDLNTKNVTITYDANKVSSQELKDDFKKFNYTVCRAYPNDIVKYATFRVKDAAKASGQLESVKGVLDANVDAASGLVALSYNTRVLADEAALMAQVKAAGCEVETNN